MKKLLLTEFTDRTEEYTEDKYKYGEVIVSSTKGRTVNFKIRKVKLEGTLSACW
jgi:hypothetical protein